MSSSSMWPENFPAVLTPEFHQLVGPSMGPRDRSSSRRSNVFHLLARRELSPHTKRSPKRFWGKVSSPCNDSCGTKRESEKDVRQELRSWVEAESLLHLSAKYCPLQPPPRSTIAAAFSPDGTTLASTHGDHTVKIIDCPTGKCLKVLSGHRRTPWVVRFHPLYPEILASGSLDHEVRLWDAKSAECIGSRDFYRPIASIAFHAQGEILAIASGHKLYMWHYNRRGDASAPTIILKTRRSLRAVHFHPQAAPFLLTAEVNELYSSDPSMTFATSPGYLRYPAPTIYLADAHSGYRSNSGSEHPIMSIPFDLWPFISQVDGNSTTHDRDVHMGSGPSQNRADTSASVRVLTYSTPSGQYELLLSPIESGSSRVREEMLYNSSMRETRNAVSQHTMITDVQPEERSNQFFPSNDPAYWEIPFLQGWLIGQSQAGQRSMNSRNGGANEVLPAHSAIGNSSFPVPPEVPNNHTNLMVPGRSGPRHQYLPSHTIPTVRSSESSAFNNIHSQQSASQPFMSQIQTEVATSLAAATAAELPCTVKLRIWSHDLKNPCTPLDTERCRLTIPHAVLCSEMGAHFSPCGRFLAVCVACILPNSDVDQGFQSHIPNDFTGASNSPTRHPISTRQVVYELRIYSLEEATFGLILASRAIRAAHCLTSIQFSPTSEHLLLAYGRRHNSLLKSVVIDGDTTVPIYTILEIYRVSDMELVRVLPSAEDEVNVACFHPLVGGGLVYGTKEGKLRTLQCDVSHVFSNEGSFVPDDNMLEVPTYALEG
ncbi:Transducin family protein / WD-40 repeat family protein [Striga hermonthica]|uniref:Transducin family protein / WD-40 repeat family protein n=1 Tax=Striga hermonthica TaxID=68872 RepID=A0A9N7N2L1_STRHE|nr:Transducin family protein / WD-40 repeat family protein [Striga hermonthica]